MSEVNKATYRRRSRRVVHVRYERLLKNLGVRLSLMQRQTGRMNRTIIRTETRLVKFASLSGFDVTKR